MSVKLTRAVAQSVYGEAQSFYGLDSCAAFSLALALRSFNFCVAAESIIST
jgi:hypothetical protein